MSLLDVSDEASWKDTLLPADIGSESHPTDHAVMQLIGATRFHFPGDLMHSSCLGILPYFLGSALWELIHIGIFVGSNNDKMTQLWARITYYYGELDITHRFTNLMLSWFEGVKTVSHI